MFKILMTCLLLPLLLGSSLGATLTVRQDGTGDYTDLATAVAAAVQGQDTVEIQQFTAPFEMGTTCIVLQDVDLICTAQSRAVIHTSSAWGIRMDSTAPTYLRNIELVGDPGCGYQYGLVLLANAFIEDCVIRDCCSRSIGWFVGPTPASGQVSNTLIYDSASGWHVSFENWDNANPGVAAGSIVFDHCTIVSQTPNAGNAYPFIFSDQFAGSTDGSFLTIKNTVLYTDAGPDILAFVLTSENFAYTHSYNAYIHQWVRDIWDGGNRSNSPLGTGDYENPTYVFTDLANDDFTPAFGSPLIGGADDGTDIGAIQSDPVTTSPLGLYIENGTYMRDGEPYYGIGMNFFNCLTRVTGEEGRGYLPDNLPSSKDGFRVLRQFRIPFIRFNASGFYPIDWNLYLTNKDAYFAVFDALVHEAEVRELGLIPSLFFAYFAVPDVVGEHLNQWGNPDSQIHAFMRQYTREVVTRYKDSPAIWGWEFSNEVILAADLPGIRDTGCQGQILPHWGTPTERTAEDVVLRDDVYVAYQAFAEEIRKYDKTRPIFTGDSLARCAAYHNYTEGTWTDDTQEQWKSMFIADNPGLIDTMTVHWYYWANSAEQQVTPRGMSFADSLAFCNQIAKENGKPLFVGECGTYDSMEDQTLRREQLDVMFNALVDNKIQLAALWVYDLPNQPGNTITETNDLAYTLDLIAWNNLRLWNDSANNAVSGCLWCLYR